MTTLQKLHRIQGRDSLYEVVALGPAGEKILIRYTGRHSFQGLFAVVRDRAPEIVALCGCDSVELIDKKTRAAGLKCGAWVIRFSGRTQRQAIQEGEHQFILEIGK